MDAGILMDLNDEIARLVEENYEIHSVLIIKDGYIVAEQYYSKYFDRETWHKIHSCTKSFTSTCIGIAIDQGYITNASGAYQYEIPESILHRIEDWAYSVGY